jgi:hydroxypyruvate isomerase
VEYARELDVGQLNCLAGLRLDGVDPGRQRATLVDNVRHAARRLRAEGRRLLVEPVNTFDVPGYVAPTTVDVPGYVAPTTVDVPGYVAPTTVDVLGVFDEVGEPDVLLQFDAYHVQRMEGDPAARLADLLDRVGHVQIADHPGRHQPGTGEIDFPALFALLDRAGYAGCVGLEYVPTPTTAASLGWLSELGLAPASRS